MTYLRCGFVAVLFGALLLFGCGITAEQQKRIDALTAENEALANKQRDLLEKIKTGTVTPTEIATAFKEVTEQMKKNADEIKAIKDSGGTMAVITAVVGVFGRTALHAAASLVPGGTPAAMALQGLLTLLLGGSETKKKEATA